MKNTIQKLMQEIESVVANPTPESVLPQNCFYMNDTDILCLERKVGVSRYIYDTDGLKLLLSSNGLIEACESDVNIFKTKHFCEDMSVTFFGGVKGSDGLYDPIALFDTQRQLREKVKRYVVFKEKCAFYIADTEKVTFALRAHIDMDKHIRFSFNAINKTSESTDIYLFSMIEAQLTSGDESFWSRMGKFGNRYGEAFVLRARESSLLINEKVFGKVNCEYKTVAKADVIGSRKTVINADCLLSGKIENEHTAVNTTDIPVAANMRNVTLLAGESIRCEYDLQYLQSSAEAKALIGGDIDILAVDKGIESYALAERQNFDNLKIRFNDWNGGVNAGLMNRFLRTVQNQVNICALGKNYVGGLNGMRDIMQQLESSIMWNPKASRAKILRAFNFILEDGRPPRQFSVPEKPNELPVFDLRPFIDQGVWIISTVYAYLAFTGDYSILDEQCTYYIPNPSNTGAMAKSDIVDSVLEHLIKIMGFLSRNIDTRYGTNCLRILRGDWNDALNGLGYSQDPENEYGFGISVMASLQFYRNCEEMIAIIKKVGRFTEKIAEYEGYRDRLATGLFEYAIDKDENGNRRIIHGIGDKLSYKLGSFCDPDGVSRISSTANSFWAISGMIKKDESLKPIIKEAFLSLRSKYGLLTFDKPFPQSMRPYAGEIAKITAGTYENSCTYVHAAMFGIMGLFSIGESEFAWQELERSSVISHKNCTMSPYVMPNSYCENPEYGMDGESMGDWYTGSGTVLIKNIVRYGFGVNPDLDGVNISLAATMPCSSAELSLKVNGKNIKLIYKNCGQGERSYEINGVKANAEFKGLINTKSVYINKETLLQDNVIIVKD